MRGFSDYKASALALVAANALPLLGVLFLGWDAFAIVALYWIENVIIGAINVLKMITCRPDPAVIDWSKLGTPDDAAKLRKRLAAGEANGDAALLAHHGSKLFLVPFFALHYGFFCFVHGIFVLVLFGHDRIGFSPFGELREFSQVVADEHLGWAVLALAGSHLYSFFANYLGRGEYRRTIAPLLMFQPYARIVALHVAILFGGWIAMALGSNAGVLGILVVGKTLLDLKLHLREHERLAAEQEDHESAGVLDQVPTASI